MVKRWICEVPREDNNLCFTVLDISEHREITEEVKKLLASNLILSFRDIEHLKQRYKNQPEEKLREYIEGKIFSSEKDGFSRATRIGDWGEVFCGLVLDQFRGYTLPIKKLCWKINNEKSLFGTDVFAVKQADNGDVESLIYSESKVRTTYSKHIGKEAYESLYKDNGDSLPDIIDFISRVYFHKGDYEMAHKFDDVFLNIEKYDKEFQIFLLFDKGIWKDEILEILNELPPELENLFVTVILIDDLRDLIDETYRLAIGVGEELVYG